MNNLVELIKHWSQDKKPPMIKLLNRNHEIVAVLYLDRLKCSIENIMISEFSLNEKYYMYLDGITIFFTYYVKEISENA